jgi:single-stranded-DNA-specific exonuclease
LIYRLINEPNKNYTATEQILYNRGIEEKDFWHYMNTTDDDICSPLELGEEQLKLAAVQLVQAINSNKRALVIVDADCDGYTSAALLINYLYDVFPAFVNNNIEWYIHSGKQHGFSDCYEKIIEEEYGLVLCPDAGSNDKEYHKMIKDKIDCDMIILDHHEIEGAPSMYAITLNNQTSQYPNKFLSGVGITWQFCRYIDKLMGKNFANDYLDLVALGNCADMMSMLSIETKHLINKGFKPECIKNPFIYEMWQKNKFKLGENITHMGAAFYIAPFVNAMVRSGTQSEKALLFNSMLKFRAFEMVDSTKRGHSFGEQERIVDQAIRTCTNVKNRQTRAQDSCMEMLESMIEKHNLLDHKVLLFLMEPGQIDRNIAGLCANKIMAKYQRPCCILTKVEEDKVVESKERSGIEIYYKDISYQGSARGYDASGVTNFKDICEQTGCTMYVAGHQGAFGLGLHWGVTNPECAEDSEMNGENIYQFLYETDKALANMSSEPIYFVDYIYTDYIDAQQILDIANLDYLWGKDMSEPYVAIQGLKITADMLTLMKSNTLKIKTGSVDILKFGCSEEEWEKLYSANGYVEINAICKCNKNEWNGNISAQLFLEDFEIADSCTYYF